jgi:hypothetical protein
MDQRERDGGRHAGGKADPGAARMVGGGRGRESSDEQLALQTDIHDARALGP